VGTCSPAHAQPVSRSRQHHRRRTRAMTDAPKGRCPDCLRVYGHSRSCSRLKDDEPHEGSQPPPPPGRCPNCSQPRESPLSVDGQGICSDAFHQPPSPSRVDQIAERINGYSISGDPLLVPRSGAVLELAEYAHEQQSRAEAAEHNFGVECVARKEAEKRVEEAERCFREGCAAGEGESALPVACPYPGGSYESHWWTRGLAHSARLMRAIGAERAHTEARMAGFREGVNSQPDVQKAHDDAKRTFEEAHKIFGCVESQEASAEIQRLEAWVDDCQSGMYINCVYCGHRYGPKESTPVSMREVLKQHVEKCPKHPLAEARAEVERLQRILDDQRTSKKEGPALRQGKGGKG